MRYVLLIVAIFVASCCELHGQILNAGFEEWTGGEPDSWLTGNQRPQVVNVTRSNDAHSGAYALRGEVAQSSGFTVAASVRDSSGGRKGFGTDHRVNMLTGWFKFHPVGTDVFAMTVVATEGNLGIGSAFLAVSDEISEWTQFALPIEYFFPSTVPDTFVISFEIRGPNASPVNLGTWFELDDIAYYDPAAVETKQTGQFDTFIYPNPVREQGSLRIDLAEESAVSVEIYDVTGKRVRTIFRPSCPKGNTVLRFERAGLTDGIYEMRISSANAIVTRQLAIIH